MAVVAIVLSSAIGFLIGLAQFAFLGVPLWQAFVTYVIAAFTLSAFTIVWSLVFGRASQAEARGDDVSYATLESWQDWQVEEEMEAERLRAAGDEDRSTVRKSA